MGEWTFSSVLAICECPIDNKRIEPLVVWLYKGNGQDKARRMRVLKEGYKGVVPNSS
jgi:hypothetical protein